MEPDTPDITAIYPGTFDPISIGHLDIIKRSLQFCRWLIIGIGINPGKTTMFDESERIDLIHKSVCEYLEPPREDGYSPYMFRYEVKPFQGLLVDFAREQKASILIRGIRSVSDFEYEINLANVNKSLAPEIETVFLPTAPELAVISSSMIKEIAKHGGDISKFVTPDVASAVNNKFGFLKTGKI